MPCSSLNRQKCQQKLLAETETINRAYAKTVCDKAIDDPIFVYYGKSLVVVSKAVLMKHSDYFRVMYNSGFQETQSNRIELHEDDHMALNYILLTLPNNFNSVDGMDNVRDVCNIHLAMKSLVAGATEDNLRAIYAVYDKYQFTAHAEAMLNGMAGLVTHTHGQDHGQRMSPATTVLDEILTDMLPEKAHPYYAQIIAGAQQSCGDDCSATWLNIPWDLRQAHPNLALLMLDFAASEKIAAEGERKVLDVKIQMTDNDLDVARWRQRQLERDLSDEKEKIQTLEQRLNNSRKARSEAMHMLLELGIEASGVLLHLSKSLGVEYGL